MRAGAALGSAIAATLLATPARADMLERIKAPFEQALGSGEHASALGLVFVAGLVTALTPCVYPMIAVTVSVFGARQTTSRAQGLLLSAVFVLGIAALFTPLGVVSALSVKAFGSALASPTVLVGLAVLFIVMGLSMFGLFDLALPSGLQNKLARLGGSGYRGAFAVGFASGLIAAPCTGPVLAVLLGWVATTGNAAFGALALFVYALGLGLLFFVVGAFAVTLPKSGRWVEWSKSLFGIAMVALGLYYLRGLIPIPSPDFRTQPWLLGSLGLLVVGLALGALHLSFKQGSGGQRFRKGLGSAAAIAGVLGLVGWAQALEPGAHIEWRDDYKAATALAQTTGQPMMVDFGADWCDACNELERGPLSDPRVVSEAQRFVTVRVDLSTNKATDQKWALLESYDQKGLPFIVLHDSTGAESGRVTGLLEADVLHQMMTRVR